MMKLWCSTTSAFARKVLTVMKHHQLESKIELQHVS